MLVAGGSEAATLFGIDGIVGAFMAGIAARRAVVAEEPARVLKVVSNTAAAAGQQVGVSARLSG